MKKNKISIQRPNVQRRNMQGKIVPPVVIPKKQANSVIRMISKESPIVTEIRKKSLSLSNNPIIRIRYLLKKGNLFLLRKDVGSAKRIYKFIYEDYSKLKTHDNIIYRAILDFLGAIK